ncbi:MAG: helical backbone metal receptor [Woeseiaceae bacterium]|nr:helical backbone metal receptor [Woeseiaceae bacterium]
MTQLRLALVTIVCIHAGVLRAETSANEATRIVTLSPHLAELVFSIGAGDRLVGVSAFTDFPEAATRLPVVGDAFMLDLERMTLLNPDLLLAWESGTPAHVVDELVSRGFRVESIRTKNLSDVPQAMLRLGALTGQLTNARAAAREFETGIAALGEAAAGAAAISVFYQISERPLYTINGEHYVSQLIEVCGGRNVFADLGKLAPLVGVEAVIERDPEVMLAADDAGADAFAAWDRWPAIAANRYGNRFLMPAAQIGRATPRLLEAGKAMCLALERGRENRKRRHD